MSVVITVDDKNLRRALSQYAVMKQKGDAEVVNKAMRFWLPYAARRVIKKTPGKRKVRAELTGPSRDYPGYTLAEAIVGWRFKKKKQKPPANFKQIVENFKNARYNSVNFLRAGFIPAMKNFNVPRLRQTGTQVAYKGRSMGSLAKPSFLFKVEAFARNAREGVTKLAPEAFQDAMPDVTRQFIKMMEEDLRRSAKKSGFF
jgi:hypothetical protein